METMAAGGEGRAASAGSGGASCGGASLLPDSRGSGCGEGCAGAGGRPCGMSHGTMASAIVHKEMRVRGFDAVLRLGHVQSRRHASAHAGSSQNQS